MGPRRSPSLSERVVALLGPGADVPELAEGSEVVVTATGYEAAAEMLCGPVAALVADLGRITAAHVPLLALAGELNVPVVGFGTPCASIGSNYLSGMHLSSPEGVGETLAGLLGERQPSFAETLDESFAAAVEPLAGQYAPSGPAETPAQAPVAAQDDPPPETELPAAEPQTPSRPSDLLSQAELNALLEDPT